MEANERRPRKLARLEIITRDGMAAAGPSVMEEFVASNIRLGGSTQQKHSIFLSHSSAQKAFVRRLQHTLQRNAYLPFFDEDPACLPKGEPFAQRIINASRLADVAVVILSHEFFNSKWPMIELAIFIEEQTRRLTMPGCMELKILPLFMGLSVEEFRNVDLQLSWLNQWHEFRTTDCRIDVSKWEEALKVLGGTNGLEYCCYKDEDDYVDSIMSAIFKLVTPALKWEDTHMKGKSKFHQVVAEMFARSPSRTRFHNVRTIGLYGMGGIGKTTLCKSLCNEYRAKFNGKVWHAELGKRRVEEIQKDVLRHLLGTPETLINQSMDCKDQRRSLLRDQNTEYKVFLAIDNVWNEDESREQAEALLGMNFHPDSLVIVTSRSREVLEWLGIHKCCWFEMPVLDKGDATAVLLQSAAPGYDIQSIKDYQQVAVDKVVERCFMTKGTISSAGSEKQYVPLALEVLGRQLRLPLGYTSLKLTDWINNLDLKRSNQKQHPIFSVLRLSYDNLPTSKHKSIFLDVALCVPRQQDNTSANVNEVCKWLSMVYCDDFDVILEVLEDLQKDGLVESWQYLASSFGMHELYCEFAKAEAAKEGDFDGQNYLYHEDGQHVPALMRWFPRHNYLPVRRIHLYNGGFKELSSRQLQYMVNVEVLKLDFCFELESLDLRCLKSLRSLELRGCFSLQMVEGLDELKSLIYFRWNTCRNSIVVADFPPALEVVEIYGSKESEVPDVGSFGGCTGLVQLTLSRHPLLAAVSDMCKLHKLEKVDFSGCCKIVEVRGLGGLRHLTHLDLENCKELRHCDGLEKLVEIQTLNLGGCENLQLPEEWDLRGLVNLRTINMRGLLVVRRLVLGSPQIEQLQVMGCRDLRTVALCNNSGSWKFLNRLNKQMTQEAIESRQWTVECWSVLGRDSFDTCKTLNLSNCHTLESLGDIGFLTSLKYLYLQNCRMLRTLPNLSGSLHLQVLDLSYCCELEDLGDIGPLRSLQHLHLEHCQSFRSLQELYSSCLKVLDLSGCSKLEDLGNFDSLSSLQVLNLKECVSLRTVPNLSSSSLLEVLNVKGCIKLTALSQMTTPHVVIDVSECWSLEKIPILNGLAILALDATIGDADRELVQNMELSEVVLKLKLTCRSDSTSLDQRSEKIEMQKLIDAPLTGMFNLDSENENAFIQSSGDDVSHFKNMRRLLDSAEWMGGQSVFPYQTFAKFSSISISCKSLTEIPSPSLFSTVSRLEIIKCRRLRRLSNLNYLPALQTLVISQCDELESLPDLRSATSLKHLTIRDFRRGPQFQFLSYMCQPVHAYPNMWMTYSGFKNLVELNFNGCVGLGGLQTWGPLPALESLLIKDCNTITQLPDLRRSSKLSNLTIMNCGMFREVVDISHAQALRVVRIERCGDEKFTDISSREELCSELVNILSEFGALDWEGISELVEWVREGEGRRHSLDMFSGITFSLFRFTGQALEKFNRFMAKWALHLPY